MAMLNNQRVHTVYMFFLGLTCHYSKIRPRPTEERVGFGKSAALGAAETTH